MEKPGSQKYEETKICIDACEGEKILDIFYFRNQEISKKIAEILYDLNIYSQLDALPKEEICQQQRKVGLLFSKISYNLRLLEKAQKLGVDFCIDSQGDVRILHSKIMQCN